MNLKEALRLGQLTDHLMTMQSLTGVCFDKEKALRLYEFCCEEMERIEKEVEPKLPERPLNKTELAKVTPPKIQFKNSKAGLIPSAACEKFFDGVTSKHSGTVEFGDDGKEWFGWLGEKFYKLPYNKPVTTTGTMRLSNQKDIKEWLLSKGWKPTIWNFKKDKNGNFERAANGKLIKTSPKFQNMGQLCPNLEKLGDAEELVKPIVRWLSLRNRRSIINNPEKKTGWLHNNRLKMDGRLPAGASSVAVSHRMKHTVVVNVPRPGSVLGEEMRELFCAEGDNVIVGYDASGLEGRIEAHYCYKHEGGEAYAYEIMQGDVHSTNARIFFGDGLPTDDDCKVISKYRNVAKSGKYCLSYGGAADKLAETLNVSRAKGKELYENFWDGNTALKGLRDALERHWVARGKKSILCGVTGLTLHARSKHSLVNLLFQHTGAIVMDVANSFMHKWLGPFHYDELGRPYYSYKGHKVKRVLFVHDEVQWECNPAIAQEIGEMGCKSIEKAGEFLKLNVPMRGEYKIGDSWKATH